jgi:hypothetical protein
MTQHRTYSTDITEACVTRIEETLLAPKRAGTSHILDYATRERLGPLENSSVQKSVLLFSIFGDRKGGAPKHQDLGPVKWLWRYKIWEPSVWSITATYNDNPINTTTNTFSHLLNKP